MEIEFNFENAEAVTADKEKIIYYQEYVIPQAMRSLKEKIKCEFLYDLYINVDKNIILRNYLTIIIISLFKYITGMSYI